MVQFHLCGPAARGVRRAAQRNDEAEPAVAEDGAGIAAARWLEQGIGGVAWDLRRMLTISEEGGKQDGVSDE